MCKCSNCGQSQPLHMLDAKPESLAGKPADSEAIWQAGERGEDFTVLECRSCYGPAWVEGARAES